MVSIKIGEAFVTVRPDTEGFGNETKSKLITPLKAAAVAAAAIAGVGLKKAFDFVKGGVKNATDLNETMNKSRVIFGSSAATIAKWARGSVTSMGLTKNEAVGAASTFGDMFRQLGIGLGPTTTMSQKMVQLGADFASFHNADITDVLLAQQSAFRGEYDALQRFVPGINAARVEQEALNLSHKSSAKDLTQAEKAQAAYNIMLRDGKRASGDFARTSQDQANQQRILGAQTKSLSTTIGSFFLPGVLAVTRALTGSLLPQLTSLATKHGPAVERAFTSMGTTVAGWIRGIDLSAVAARTVSFLRSMALGVRAFGEAFKGNGITTEAGTLVGTMERLGVAARGFVDRLRGVAPQAQATSGAMSALGNTASVFGVTIGFVASHLDTFAKLLPAIIVAFGVYKVTQAAANVAALAAIPATFANAGATLALAAANRSLATSLATRGAAQIGATGSTVALTGATNLGAVTALRSAAAWVASRAAMIAGAVATGIMTAAQWALNVALTANPIGIVVVALAALVVGLVIAYKKSATFRGIVQAAFRGVLASGRALWSAIQAGARLFVSALVRGASIAASFRARAVASFQGIMAAARVLVSVFTSSVGRLVSAASNAGNRVTSFFRSLPGRIRGALGNLGGLLFSAGVNVVQGLINGITSRIGAVVSAASRLAGAIRGALPFSPAKYGPLSGSGAPERSGRKIPRDIAKGLLRGRGGLQRAMERAMPGIPGAGMALAGAGAGAGRRVHVTLAPGAVQVSGVGGNLTVGDVQRAVAGGISEGVRLLDQGRRF